MNTKNSSQNRSRARSTPSVKDRELQALRVQTWYRHVLERALGNEVDRHAYLAARTDAFGAQGGVPDLNAALQRWLNEQVEQNLARLTSEEAEAAQRLSRGRYDEGKSTPTAMTLGVFEVLLEGSAAIYDEGPGELPLWQVLDGDLKACRAYVQELLSPSASQWTKGFHGLVQTVFDDLIAPAYRVDMNAIPTLSAPQREAHPVWQSFIDRRYAATLGDDEGDRLTDVMALDASILLAIALAHLAVDTPSSPRLQLEWLLVGLCWGV